MSRSPASLTMRSLRSSSAVSAAPNSQGVRMGTRSLSAEQGCECAEECRRGCDPQSRSLGHGRPEVLGVVRQQPVGFAGHGRQKYRHIGEMPNQMTLRPDTVCRRMGYKLRLGQLNETAIIFDQFAG